MRDATGGRPRLPTEAPNPRTADMDRLATADLVALVLDESGAAFRAARDAAPRIAAMADAAADRVRRGGRIVYAGAGTSGRLALLDAVELPPTFSFPPERAPALLAGGDGAVFRAVEGAEDDRAAGAADARRAGAAPDDFFVCVAASGRTPWVGGVLDAARAAGSATALVCCAPPEFAADHVVLLATGAEPLAGSTRMNAGTATKLALNAFSLAVMTRLGKVHGNRMVDVRIGNAKLRDRAVRMVSELGGCGEDAASRALDACGGHVKTAVLCVLRGLEPAAARARLAAAGDSLRAALGGDAP